MTTSGNCGGWLLIVSEASSAGVRSRRPTTTSFKESPAEEKLVVSGNTERLSIRMRWFELNPM
jgi:hypothetical protein